MLPIDAEAYSEFILDELPYKAKFYAYKISDDEIRISIQMNGDNEIIPFKTIDKRYFKYYFKVMKE